MRNSLFPAFAVTVAFLALSNDHAHAQRSADMGGYLDALSGSANLSFNACAAKSGAMDAGMRAGVSGMSDSETQRATLVCTARAKRELQPMLSRVKGMLSRKPKAVDALKAWYSEWTAAFERLPMSNGAQVRTTDMLDRLISRVSTEASW